MGKKLYKPNSNTNKEKMETRDRVEIGTIAAAIAALAIWAGWSAASRVMPASIVPTYGLYMEEIDGFAKNLPTVSAADIMAEGTEVGDNAQE